MCRMLLSCANHSPKAHTHILQLKLREHNCDAADCGKANWIDMSIRKLWAEIMHFSKQIKKITTDKSITFSHLTDCINNAPYLFNVVCVCFCSKFDPNSQKWLYNPSNIKFAINTSDSEMNWMFARERNWK